MADGVGTWMDVLGRVGEGNAYVSWVWDTLLEDDEVWRGGAVGISSGGMGTGAERWSLG